ncbi:MAG TPA: VWA domain-containing protein [Candidatus Acidoferrales bacterium]|nr:VWA domain-containing protein [Candidatus Acidoferrales bacterium]
MPRRAPATTGVFCILAIAALGADSPQVSVKPRNPSAGVLPNIRVDSNLVLIPVSVTDPKNRAVTGLQREDFRVFEGKAEQTLVQFAREDAPLSVGIVFDSSGSMQTKLARAREAVKRFLAAANPEDEFFLVSFSSTAKLAVSFTPDRDDIRNHLLSTHSAGRTALLDAVCLAMDYMRNAHNSRKALLVISDGGDNDSRYTEAEIRRRVIESDLWIYTLGIYESRGIMLPEGDHGELLMQTLAEQSGARHFAVQNTAELPQIAENIGLELRNQYLIGYRPATSSPGKYHRVQVKVVDHREYRVAWRPGYFEPE